MPNIHNVKTPRWWLLSSVCALTSQEVCVFEVSAPLLSFFFLPHDAAGEKEVGNMVNAKGSEGVLAFIYLCLDMLRENSGYLIL